MNRDRPAVATPEGESPGKHAPRVDSQGSRIPSHLAVWFAMLAVVVNAAARFQIADPDMFHQMALFRAALQLGHLPREDIFAYTPTVPLVPYEWGTGAVLYFMSVGSGLGPAGVLILRYVLIAITILTCVTCARRRGATWGAMAIAAPTGIALYSLGLATVRAHMFTFLFVGALLMFIEHDRRGGRWWIAGWLTCYTLWLNLHGGFVVGLGFFGVYVLERLWREYVRLRSGWWVSLRGNRHLLLTLAAMFGLSLVSPAGWDYAMYVRDAITLDRPRIEEWAPLWDPRIADTKRFAYSLGVAFVAYALVRTRKQGLPEQWPILALATIAPLSAQRLLPIFAVVWYCYLPPILSRTLFADLVASVWRRARPLVTALAFLWGVWELRQAADYSPFELRMPTVGRDHPVNYPAGAVDYLRLEGFRGNLMTPFNVGAFVSWELYPSVLVGMDGRYEVAYPPEAVEENYRLYYGVAGWLEAIERYPTDAILVPRSGPLNVLMRAKEAEDGRWRLVYRDDAYGVFARSSIAEGLSVVDRTGEKIVARFP